MVDRLRFMNLPAAQGAQGAYRLVDALHGLTAEEQLAAAAILFVNVADLYRMPVPDVVQAVRNMTTDPKHGQRDEFRALRLYVQGQLAK